jgi:F-type H+-transporting ATPase subunit gamma
MDTVEAVKSRIQTTEDLQSVVKTMKALAAVNIRHYEKAAASFDEYYRTIELGLQVILRDRSSGERWAGEAPMKRIGAIVFGSDQGMCGQLNDRVAHRVSEEFQRLDKQPAAILAIGVRVAGRLEDAGFPPERTLSVPGSTTAIVPSVQEILLHLDVWHEEQEIDAVLLEYCHHQSGASYQPVIQQLLPVDRQWLADLEKSPWPTKVLPMFTMDRAKLFSALIRQYLFVSLHRAFAESLASENASRLASMQNAERNIAEQLDELTSTYHQRRQMSVTEELLDIVSGFEALGGGDENVS